MGTVNHDRERLSRHLFLPEFDEQWIRPCLEPLSAEDNATLASGFPRGPKDGYLATEPFPWEAARRLTQEFKRIRHFFYGDFYPLTRYSVTLETWMAYQFHREDLGQGIVLAFRRPKCDIQTLNVKLWGLSPEASYEVHFEDSGVRRTFKGKELAKGLDLTTEKQPGSLLISYRQIP